MTKDCFGNRFTPVRSPMWERKIKAVDNTTLVLHYITSERASFGVIFEVDGKRLLLFDVLVSFCLNCGRFLGLGNRFDICWECQENLEDEGDEDFE